MEGKETYSQRHCLNISWTTVSHPLFERFMRSLSGLVRLTCGTPPGNSVLTVTCPVVDRSQLKSCLVSSHLVSGRTDINGYIPDTLQDAERTRTGQTAYQRTSNVHPPDISIRWRPFEVLTMFKTCQRIRLDKTDITWHGTHSPHGKRTRNACERTRTDREFYCPLRVR